MQRIERASEVSYTINQSRFVGFAIPCAGTDDLRRCLSDIARAHGSAHHLTYGFRIRGPTGIVSQCSDGGEPSGTAGRPILSQIEGRDAVDTLVAVVRYFGGIKLGTGGLARAYGGTAKMALDAATLVPYVAYAELRLRVDYAQLQHLGYQVEKVGGTILDREFGEQVMVAVRVPEAEVRMFKDRFDNQGR
ncbi:MAG: DUF1949 domain-containing protein [Methylococcaceae bacterium]|nr:DUF1949 domain-containing protein [Methylococcaceae bacterium]